jgi:hypothetical protein
MRRRVRSLGMMGRARKSGASSPLLRAAETTFHPQDVAEVSNGYFWDPYADAIGLGTADFRVREGNGHSTFDLIQATVANQPTVLTENGGTQFRMRKAADPNPAKIAMSAGVAAGWTGATYIGMWLRLPVDTTGVNNLFLHATTGGLSRITFTTINGTPDIFRVNLIDAAQAFTNSQFSTPFADLGWHWTEAIFDPLLVLGGSGPNDYVKAFDGFVALTRTATATHPAAIADVAAAVRLAQSNSGSATDTDDYDWAACYYANGIPSLANRVRLANHRNPTGVAFA